jgi:3-dehydroquinate dehydratase-2
MSKILIINGPNLNLLGQREPSIYGRNTLEEINGRLSLLGQEWGLEVSFFQSNCEGMLVEAIQNLPGKFDGAILNAGAYTHTSLALHDAVSAVSIPVVEVHLSNPAARESYRHFSYLSGVCRGAVSGFGPMSYELALYWLASQAKGCEDFRGSPPGGSPRRKPQSFPKNAPDIQIAGDSSTPMTAKKAGATKK